MPIKVDLIMTAYAIIISVVLAPRHEATLPAKHQDNILNFFGINIFSRSSNLWHLPLYALLVMVVNIKRFASKNQTCDQPAECMLYQQGYNSA
jgi:hypothetical protein